MNLYICRRCNSGEPWMGALIILAESVDEAKQIFIMAEGFEPDHICLNTVKEGIVWNDYSR